MLKTLDYAGHLRTVAAHWTLTPVLLVTLCGCSAGIEPREGVAAAASTKVKRVDYLGWTGAWRLTNGRCELVVVPAVGRVMHFSRAGGPNLLWVNPERKGDVRLGNDGKWLNVGGDKMWPTEQARWRQLVGRTWPPDPAYDGAPCAARPIQGGVRIETPLSEKLGARAVREFTLVPGRAAVRIRQWQEKVRGDAVPLSVWTVTQIRTPAFALLPKEDDPDHPYRLMPGKKKGKKRAPVVRVLPSAVSIANHPERGQKIGVGGEEGWVAALIGKTLFVQTHAVDLKGSYPDGGCQAEVYTAKGVKGYVELELLSPLRTCKVGDTLRDDAVWELVPVTEAQRKDPEEVARRARGAYAWAVGLLE